jgi:hypothetical protein
MYLVIMSHQRLFNVPTFDNFHTRKRKKDDTETIRIWFKYQI